MAAILKVDRCMVKGVRSWTSDKSHKTYDSLVVSIGVEDAEIGCGDYDLSGIPTMVPVQIEAQIVIRRIGTRQNIEFSGSRPEITPLK